ncbi:MAG: SDR family NAD(P)-dependent oxidoreductase [Bacteroidaceae bacterium]|nr:SDR family NAD(P)-dependent oxidoreductase [Bacteroidaceae bacterium]
MTSKNKAIVMGATSGIGYEVARILAESGWQVAICGRREQLLQQAKEAINGDVLTARIDINEEQAPQQLLQLIEQMNGIDLYLHSSGIGYQNVALDLEKEMNTVQTNTMGFTRMITAVYTYFAEHPEKEGHIACISSIAGTKGLGAAPAYSSTKRFQSFYMECLTQQAHIRGLNIHFTDIRPGFVTTELIKDSNFPMQLKAPDVARQIVRALKKKKAVVTIDWRYHILVFFWRMIPRWLWVRLKVKR